jgi:hypothetical protein
VFEGLGGTNMEMEGAKILAEAKYTMFAAIYQYTNAYLLYIYGVTRVTVSHKT